MRFAFCNEMFEGWKWQDVCKAASQHGYDGVEIAPFTFADDVRLITPAERKEIREVAKKHGLEIVGTHWLLVKPTGMGLFAEDPKVRKFTEDYLLHQVDFCADLGGRVMTFGSPAQRNVPDGYDRNFSECQLVDTLRRVGERAAERDVMFCVEPLPSTMTNIMQTVAEAERISSLAAHPNIGFMLDVKSMCAETTEPSAMIRKYAGRFGHFHANDSNMSGPGFGDVDYKPIMQALVETGYSGYVSVEVFDFKPGPVTIAEKSIVYMRSCM